MPARGRSAPSAASSPSMRGSAKATRRARSTTRIVSPRSHGLDPARSKPFLAGRNRPKQVEWLEISMEIFLQRADVPRGFQERYLRRPRRAGAGRNGQARRLRRAARALQPRRGGATPPSQYGLLKTWRIGSLGCTLDGEPLSSVTVADLQLDALEYIPLRIGIHADAAHVGGINLFGEKFGDFAQGIVVRVGYDKAD